MFSSNEILEMGKRYRGLHQHTHYGVTPYWAKAEHDSVTKRKGPVLRDRSLTLAWDR